MNDDDSTGSPRTPVRFELGAIVATPGALRVLQAHRASAMTFVERHARRDWGAVCADDAQANDRALADGGRLLSAYALPNGERLWVITEADRSVTTVLLPGEY